MITIKDFFKEIENFELIFDEGDFTSDPKIITDVLEIDEKSQVFFRLLVTTEREGSGYMSYDVGALEVSVYTLDSKHKEITVAEISSKINSRKVLEHFLNT